MDDDRPKSPRWIGLWKLVVGLIFVGTYIRALLRPEREYPAALQYANETQRIAGNVTQFAIFLLGVALIFLWIRSIWMKPKQ
jgi:hypothetical protein